MERQQGEKPRSEPDSGNPTVRDRRGACGNVGYGEKGRPLRYRKRVYGSIPPKVKRAVFLSRLGGTPCEGRPYPDRPIESCRAMSVKV